VRALTSGQRLLAASGRFRFTGKCELLDQNGVYRDVTNWYGTNWFTSATWTENSDQPVSTGTVTLAREDRGISMAPAIGGSPINQVAMAYSPFLVEGHGVRLSVAITPEGTAPVLADFVEAFIGQYDDVKLASDKNEITLDIRDKGAFIVDTMVRTRKVYATEEEGALLETVVQQIIDDTLGPGVITLYVPVGTGTKVHNVDVDSKSLMEAIRDVALMIGADIRYRYDAAGVSRLTLSRPNRGVVAGEEQAWFAANEYIAIPRLDTSVVDVRNVVRVDFTNADTGKPDFIEVTDAVSAGRYGARWMQLGFAKTSTINTRDEAETLGNFGLHDLAYPFSDHDVELFPCFWAAQLGDYYGFRANGKVYDSDQRAGVFGFTHTLENASGSTLLTTKARVVGAFREWQRRSDSEKGFDTTTSEDTRALALKNFREVRRTPTVVTFGWDPVGPDVAEIWAWGKLSPQDVDPPIPPGAAEDRLWRDTKAETPDSKLDRTTIEFAVTVPDFGNVQTWELLPIGAKAERGYAQRVKVLATPDVPRITSMATAVGASGLFVDITALNVVDPQALGGTLRAWVNHGTIDDGDASLAPDGTITCAITPHVFTNADAFTVPGGTAPILDNIRIHPGKGKRVFFEFVNTRGISSGVIAFVLLSNGGIIDSNGDLLDDSIKRASQIVDTMSMPEVYDVLPAVGRDNELAVLTTSTPTPNALYRWTGTVWERVAYAPDMTGLLVGAQLAAQIIDKTKIAASLAPPEIFASVGALPASPGVNRIALVGEALYRSTADGSGWTAATPATSISGQITTAQIAAGAVTTATIATAAITTALLAGGAVTNAILAAGAVTATTIADGSITTPKLVAGAVTANEIAAGAVIAGKIAANAVTATEIVAGAITTAKIATGAVTTGTLDALAVTTAKIAAGAVTATEIATDAVTASKILAGSIVAGKIAAAAVSTTELAADAVTTSKILAGAIVTTHMSANTIAGDRITGGSLDAAKITAGSITATQLGANSVITAKLAAGAVTATAIAAGAVTATKLSISVLSDITTDAGIIVTGKLQSIDGLRYLDLNATGSNPFLQHPSVTLRADGTATFGGVVTATSFTGSNATFSNGATVAGATLFVTGGNVVFGSGAAPRVGPDGSNLLLSGSTSGTSLTGYVTKNRGGIGSPIPVPGVVIDAVGGVFPTVANYSVGDLLLDIVNQIGYVRDPTNWQRFT
jgi:hypothetical protein